MLLALQGWLRALPRSAGCLHALSDPVRALLSGACMEAALQKGSLIRGAHILMTLVDQPSLLHCNHLWSLLT